MKIQATMRTEKNDTFYNLIYWITMQICVRLQEHFWCIKKRNEESVSINLLLFRCIMHVMSYNEKGLHICIWKSGKMIYELFFVTFTSTSQLTTKKSEVLMICHPGDNFYLTWWISWEGFWFYVIWWFYSDSSTTSFFILDLHVSCQTPVKITIINGSTEISHRKYKTLSRPFAFISIGVFDVDVVALYCIYSISGVVVHGIIEGSVCKFHV